MSSDVKRSLQNSRMYRIREHDLNQPYRFVEEKKQHALFRLIFFSFDSGCSTLINWPEIKINGKSFEF